MTCQRINNDGYRITTCGSPATHELQGRRYCRRCFYLSYLDSSKWESIRDRAIRRTRSSCECCGDRGARGKNGNVIGFNVHHLTYEHLGNERDVDLVVLCRRCHERIHQLPPADPQLALKAIRLASSFDVYEALITGHQVALAQLDRSWLKRYAP